MIRKPSRAVARAKRHYRLRNSISGTAQKPRLAVFRSNMHTAVRQADRQRTDKRRCRKLLGDGFHGETSLRIFTKSVGLAHGNCKRFRTKPRFRSTKWSVRIKKCQEQAVLLAGKIFGCDGGHRGRACRGEHCSPAEPRRGNPFTGKHRHIRPSSGSAGPPSPLGGRLGNFIPANSSCSLS